MKIISRFILFVLTVSFMIFACPPSVGYATLKPGATPKNKVDMAVENNGQATHRRGLIEFCELYMQRFTAYQKDNHEDYNIHVLGIDNAPYILNDDYAMFNSTAGSIDVYLPDYTVSGITMTYSDLGADVDNNECNFISCIMAISALEYDYADDYSLYIRSKINGGVSNATDEVFRIWGENIAVPLLDKLDIARESGEKIMVYSGNYDYYIAYYSGDRDGRQYAYYYLIATEHK